MCHLTSIKFIIHYTEFFSEILIRNILIKTTVCFFSPSVYAKDGGLPPNYAKATVRIRVLDENDNAPVFGRLYYSIEVPENLDALLLFTLRATDQDEGDNGEMNYRISGEDLF